jgi:hypothetical protein
MSDRFEDDLMEDLMAEPEGRSHSAAEPFDPLDDPLDDPADDPLDDPADDPLDDPADDPADDPLDDPADDPLDDPLDELEEAVTDALEAEDADEFFGGFRNILKTVGKVARKVAPIAKLIPIPQAQLIGGAADLIGNVLADEGDEMDALDELADFADEEDGFDALSPAIAGLAIRGALKHKAAAIPRVHRRQLVKTVSAVTKHIARKLGPQAIVAVPGLVRHAHNVVVRKGLPAKHLPHLVARAARLALRSPRVLRKFASTGARLHTARMGYRAGGVRRPGRIRYGGRRYGAGGYGAGGYAPGGYGAGGYAPGGYGAGGYAPGGYAPGGYGAGGYGAGGYGPGGKSRAGGVALGGRVSRGGKVSLGGAGAHCPTCRRRIYRLRGPITLTIQGH